MGLILFDDLVEVVETRACGLTYIFQPLCTEHPASISPAKKQYLLSMIAVCVVAAIYSNRHLIAFFSNRASRVLGDISFPLYIIHFAILISLTSWLIITSSTELNQPIIALRIISLSIFSSVVAAVILRHFEESVLRNLDLFVRKLFSPEE